MQAALVRISRHAPVPILASAFLGLAIPGLAEHFRPAVVPISIATVVVSMLRIEPLRLMATLRRPLFILASSLTILCALPLLTFAVALLFGAPGWLATGLTLASAAPPLSSAAAFAILVRANPVLTTGISLPATFLAPVTVWLLTVSFDALGESVAIGALVLRLLSIIFGAIAVAILLRWMAGAARVSDWEPGLDTLTVILVCAIAIGVMHEIGIAFRDSPIAWLLLLALTTIQAMISLLLVVTVFRTFGREEAIAAGLCASVKNMALMVAAVLGTVDPRIALVVITAQLPIFLAPLVMRPIFARLRTAGGRS